MSATTDITTRSAVPLPAGATFADTWQGEGDEMPRRAIGSDDRRITDNVLMAITAIQFADGTIGDGDRSPGVIINMERVSAEQIPDLIAALRQALTEIERWQTMASEA